MWQPDGPLGVEVSFCVVNTEPARAAGALPRRDRGRARGAAVRDRGARARQRLERRVGRRGARGTRRSTEVIALRPAPRQGRERQRPAAARPRPLLPAAQRGLRAAARRDRRAARRARAEHPAAAAAGARSCAPTAACSRRPGASRRRATALAARSSCTGASPSSPAAARPARVDWAQSAALLVRRDAAARDRLVRPAFFVYSDEVDFCKRLRDAGWRTLYVPVGAGRPPRAAVDRRRCPSGGSSSSRATATATCASTTPRPPRSRCAAHRVDLRGARGRRDRRSPATTRGATGATSPRRCAPHAARACARPRRAQPGPAA